MPNRYTFVLARGGGFSFAGTLSLGSPMHLSEASVTNGRETFAANEASEGCNANPQTDAAIPAIVTLTNTTTAFAAEGAAHIVGSEESPPVIEVANYFRGGPLCRRQVEVEGWITEQVQPGQSSTELLMIYIKGYYSPDKPAGDRGLLARCHIVIGGSTDKSHNSWGVQSLRGPGATGSAAAGYEIGLTG